MQQETRNLRLVPNSKSETYASALPRLKKLLHKGMTFEEYEKLQRSRKLDPDLKKQLTCAPEYFAEFEEKQRRQSESAARSYTSQQSDHNRRNSLSPQSSTFTPRGARQKQNHQRDKESWQNQHARAQSLAGLETWELEQERQQLYQAPPKSHLSNFSTFPIPGQRMDDFSRGRDFQIEVIAQNQVPKQTVLNRLGKNLQVDVPRKLQFFPPKPSPSKGRRHSTGGSKSATGAAVNCLPFRIYSPKANAFYATTNSKHLRSHSETLNMSLDTARTPSKISAFSQRSLPVDFSRKKIFRNSSYSPESDTQKSRKPNAEEVDELGQKMRNGFYIGKKSNSVSSSQSSGGKSPKAPPPESVFRQTTLMSWKDVDFEEQPVKSERGIMSKLTSVEQEEEEEDLLTFDTKSQEWVHPNLDKMSPHDEELSEYDCPVAEDDGEEDWGENVDYFGATSNGAFQAENEFEFADSAGPREDPDREADSESFEDEPVDGNGHTEDLSDGEGTSSHGDEFSRQLTDIIEQYEEEVRLCMDSGNERALSDYAPRTSGLACEPEDSDNSDSSFIVRTTDARMHGHVVRSVSDTGDLNRFLASAAAQPLSEFADDVDASEEEISSEVIPFPDALQFVKCQRCDSVIPVPPESAEGQEESGRVRLRCMTCFHISNYKSPTKLTSAKNPNDSDSDSESVELDTSLFRRIRSLDSLKAVRIRNGLKTSVPDARLAEIESDIESNLSRAALSEKIGRKQVLKQKIVNSRSLTNIVFDPKSSDNEEDFSGDDTDTELIDFGDISVNGVFLTKDQVKRAQLKSGPIEPGHYWYDSKAGFWGVYGGPSMGIIPTGIPEFTDKIEESCANGSTHVWVNGRHIHKKDMKFLLSKGLSSKRDVHYDIDQNGIVYIHGTDEILHDLGKLRPSLQGLRKGFGMYQPKFQVE